MKSFKILITAAAVATLSLAACSKDPYLGKDGNYAGKTGIDESKANVVGLTFDAENSDDTHVAFFWTAKPAVDAGAKSFSIQLIAHKDGSDGDMYDAAKSQTIQANSEKNEQVIFNVDGAFSPGDRVYVRIRSNYPGSVFSPWLYLKKKGVDAVVKVGGTVIAEGELEPPTPITLTAAPKRIFVSWPRIDGASYYTVDYKTTLAQDWNSLPQTSETSTQITNLEYDTEYNIRVRAYGNDGSVSEYVEGSISTNEDPQIPMEIRTAEDFCLWLQRASKADPDDTYTIANDIDMSGASVSTLSSFGSKLNGNNHTISNIALGAPLIDELTSNGEISNLTVNCNANYVPKPAQAGQPAENLIFGALVEENNGTITSCTVTGSINLNFSSDSSDDGFVVGGIVGKNNGVMSSCTNQASINVNASGLKIYTPVVGGVCAITRENSTVSACSNQGNITVTCAELAGALCNAYDGADTENPVGGIAGISELATISNCANSGTIKVDSNDAKMGGMLYVGGIVGSPTKTIISSCNNNGEVIANMAKSNRAITSGKVMYVGGIVGGLNTKLTSGYEGADIDNCSNTAKITLLADFRSNNCLGGICGQAQNDNPTDPSFKINGSSNSGTVYFKGKGGARIGGISGSSANIEGCTMSGDISVDDIAASAANIGGIIGYNSYGRYINNTVFSGSITNKLAGATIYIGGIAGSVDNNNATWTGNRVSGTVTGNSSARTANKVAIFLGSGASVQEGTTYTFASSKVVNGCKINGTAVTASNMGDYFAGDGKAVDGKVTTAKKGILDFTGVSFE